MFKVYFQRLREFSVLPEFVPLETVRVDASFPERVLKEAGEKVGVVYKLESGVPDFRFIQPPKVSISEEAMPNILSKPQVEVYPLEWFRVYLLIPFVLCPDELLQRIRPSVVSALKDELFYMFKSGELPAFLSEGGWKPVIAYSDCEAELTVGVKPRRNFVNRLRFLLMGLMDREFELRGEFFAKVTLTFRIAVKAKQC